MTGAFLEREWKFDVDPGFEVADVAAALPPGGRVENAVEQLRSDYYDTADHALLGAHLTLRHRTGTNDQGWQLKVPHPPFRQEIAIAGDGDQVPAEAIDLMLAITRGRQLDRIAVLSTRRTVIRLLDAEGTKLAEIDDDEVRAAVPPGAPATTQWREVEVELGGEDVDESLLHELAGLLRDSGARPSAHTSKLRRALGMAEGLASEEGAPPDIDAASVLSAYLGEQRRVIVAGDIALRRGDDSAIHKTRVATRRWRSMLRTFAAYVEEDRATELDQELRWFAGLMGEVRDRQVLATRLQDMVASLDPTLVLGPVAERIRRELTNEQAEHWGRLHEGMRDQRYLDLCAELAAWMDAPPWTPKAHDPAGALRKQFKKARGKVSGRLTRAHASGDADDLHGARKAAKRARYAAESLELVLGPDRSAKQAARYEKLQDILGEHQDSLVSGDVLRRFGVIAGTTGGENGFTFGILYEQEQHAARKARKTAWSRAHAYEVGPAPT